MLYQLSYPGSCALLFWPRKFCNIDLEILNTSAAPLSSGASYCSQSWCPHFEQLSLPSTTNTWKMFTGFFKKNMVWIKTLESPEKCIGNYSGFQMCWSMKWKPNILNSLKLKTDVPTISSYDQLCQRWGSRGELLAANWHMLKLLMPLNDNVPSQQMNSPPTRNC